MSNAFPAELQGFAKSNGLLGLSSHTVEKIQSKAEGYTVERGHGFLRFGSRIEKELLQHRIITRNEYTHWFSQGDLREKDVRHFLIQFSVFSNLFMVAQLYKVIHADSLESMRASKEILANELGVIFRPTMGRESLRQSRTSGLEFDQNTDPELVSPEGTVEGGTFRFTAAHFEWLVRMAEVLGISFGEIGKRKHGTPSTLFFCDELQRLYGSDEYETAQAASYAVENWAAAGFWKQLIAGLQKYKSAQCPRLPLGFFTYHDRLEAQHAEHTQEELEEYYFSCHSMDEDHFIESGNEMLNGVARFWDGLNKDRQAT